jgi:hypothetical protein
MTMKDDPKKQIQLDNIHQINMKNLESKYSNSKKKYAVDTSCKFITVFCGIGVNEFLAKFSPPGMAVVVSIK